MGKVSTIEWTDATVNFWWGCTKVGPGCDHCYAEAWDKRTGGEHWGLNAPRKWIKSAGETLTSLQKSAERFENEHGRRRRVFIQSMSDLFDLEVHSAWFAAAWDHMAAADRLDIQVVTKRVSAVTRRLSQLPVYRKWPKHIGLMVTVTDQVEANRDVPRLAVLKDKLNIPWIGTSTEPMLGPINYRGITYTEDAADIRYDALAGKACVESEVYSHRDGLPRLDWIIVGGESGSGSRPMAAEWARKVRDDCAATGVPFMFKQWGTNIPDAERAGQYRRVTKAESGRLLDGREHNGFPGRLD